MPSKFLFSTATIMLITACATALGADNAAAASPIASEKFRPCVVIDPGHGGKDPGTQSRAHVAEKEVTLAVALKLAADLRLMGIDVVLTRQTDTFVSLDNRVNFSNARGAVLFVSLHCDANKDASLQGFSVLRARQSSLPTAGAGEAIAQSLHSVGIPQRGLRRDDRGLRVLNGTQAAAVLVEMGFLSNRTEASRLATGIYQEKIANALAEGIKSALKLP